MAVNARPDSQHSGIGGDCRHKASGEKRYPTRPAAMWDDRIMMRDRTHDLLLASSFGSHMILLQISGGKAKSSR
ncbi:hypothetical protein [Sphingopyxis sp. H115]|uniref:hypothetical protein n=1 Tax=Sphingopyxis sp. H115 TaxID=1759073 RepID=UPI000B337333|nr:hypothetical protein [Sphingopyxis sp. H115]